MSYWTLRLGIALLAIGLVLLSPIADLLPLYFWPKVRSLFFGEAPSQHAYMRIVPGEQSRIVELTHVGIGLLLIVFTLHFSHKK